MPTILVPRAPIKLIHGRAGRHLERYAAMKNFQNIPVLRKHTFDIFGRLAVLYLVIHMEHAQFSSGGMPADIIHAKIQQYAAVLASRKGDIDIIEIIENDFQPFLRRFIYIQPVHTLQFFGRHSCILSYFFHSVRERNPRPANSFTCLL